MEWAVRKCALRKAAAALLWVWLWANPSQAATLWRYPYLQDVRTNSAVVMWATLESGAGVVQFSIDKSFSRSATAQTRLFTRDETVLPNAITQYEALLTGLSPGTVYYYRVLVDGQDLTPNDELKLKTAGPGPFTFLAFGDSGMGTLEQQQVATRMSLENPALVLHTGDIAYMSGTYEQFESRHFGVYAFLMKRAPFYPIAGNHEYITNHGAPFVAMHSFPTNGNPAERNRYYSFDWGNVHFVGLDSNDPLENAAQGRSPMLTWLDDDLARSKQFWRVVYFHHPPYAYGPNQEDGLERLVRERILPILDKHDVQLVLSGHEHSYQRSFAIRDGRAVSANTGTVYIVTGGGGAALYPVGPGPALAFGASLYHYLRVDVDGGRMTISPIGVDGAVIEKDGKPVVLQPAPLLQPEGVVNAASYFRTVAPGSLISVFGRFLALEERGAQSLPLPQSLAGTEVTLNGRRLPLLYASRTQLNVQLPFDVTGQGTLRVTTPNGFADTSINVSAVSPGLFIVNSATGITATLHADGSLVTANSPALPGEFVSLYMTGLGAVLGEIGPGQPAPVAPPLAVRARVRVTIGNLEVAPSFAGLAPGFAGLYQVNIQIPAGITPGTLPIKVAADEIPSNFGNIVVQTLAQPRP